MLTLEQQITAKKAELAALEQKATELRSSGSKAAIDSVVAFAKSTNYISAWSAKWDERMGRWYVWTEQNYNGGNAALISATLADSLSFSVDSLTVDETLQLLGCLNDIYRARDEKS